MYTFQPARSEPNFTLLTRTRVYLVLKHSQMLIVVPSFLGRPRCWELHEVKCTCTILGHKFSDLVLLLITKDTTGRNAQSHIRTTRYCVVFRNTTWVCLIYSPSAKRVLAQISYRERASSCNDFHLELFSKPSASMYRSTCTQWTVITVQLR